MTADESKDINPQGTVEESKDINSQGTVITGDEQPSISQERRGISNKFFNVVSSAINGLENEGRNGVLDLAVMAQNSEQDLNEDTNQIRRSLGA